MDNSTVNNELDLAHPHSLPLDEKAKQVILLELERILESLHSAPVAAASNSSRM
jgi:hypothetical protein